MTENSERRSRLWTAAILSTALAMALAFCIGIALSATSVGAAAPTTGLLAKYSVRPHLPAVPLDTDTPTPTSTPGPILVGHVSRSGVPSGPRNVQPISLTLSMGGTQIDYPTQ